MNPEMEQINARMIIEAQGKPAEFVSESLRKLVAKMNSISGVEVYEEKHESPVETTIQSNQGKIFSGLVDIGVRVKDFETLVALVIGFGPSSVIILEPDKIEISARELQNIMNDLAGVIHTLANTNLDLRVKNYIMGGLLNKQQPLKQE